MKRSLDFVRLKVALRFSEDQPRDSHGRFGSGDSSKVGETAKSVSEHDAAVAVHKETADRLALSGDAAKYGAHMGAAKAHMISAAIHSNATTSNFDRSNASKIAQDLSKKANSL